MHTAWRTEERKSPWFLYSSSSTSASSHPTPDPITLSPISAILIPDHILSPISSKSLINNLIYQKLSFPLAIDFIISSAEIGSFETFHSWRLGHNESDFCCLYHFSSVFRKLAYFRIIRLTSISRWQMEGYACMHPPFCKYSRMQKPQFEISFFLLKAVYTCMLSIIQREWVQIVVKYTLERPLFVFSIFGITFTFNGQDMTRRTRICQFHPFIWEAWLLRLITTRGIVYLFFPFFRSILPAFLI